MGGSTSVPGCIPAKVLSGIITQELVLTAYSPRVMRLFPSPCGYGRARETQEQSVAASAAGCSAHLLRQRGSWQLEGAQPARHSPRWGRPALCLCRASAACPPVQDSLESNEMLCLQLATQDFPQKLGCLRIVVVYSRTLTLCQPKYIGTESASASPDQNNPHPASAPVLQLRNCRSLFSSVQNC